MTDKQRRLKELEEKKKKLEEYKKNRNQPKVDPTPAPVVETSSQSETGILSIRNADNLDALLSTLDKVIPASPAPASPSVTEQQIKEPKEDDLFGRKKVNLSQLKIQMNVVSFELAPKETEVYTKSTQTHFDNDDGTVPGSGPEKEYIHVESSLKKTKEKEPEETQTKPEPTEQKPEEPPAPIELDPVEAEKIIKSEEFQAFIEKSSRYVERALDFSTKYDILIDYAATDDTVKEERKKEITVPIKLFEERWCKHRSITDIGWSPKHSELVLASYSQNETGSNDPDGQVLVWNLQLQKIEYRFQCQSPVMTAFFSQFSPTIIVGGCYSGQIAIWDLRSKNTPIQNTPISAIGHTHPVYSMAIVGTKNAHNLVSISTDGKMCVWNLENLIQPQEVLELHNKQSKPVTATAPVAVTCVAFPEGEVNGFFVGSEEGAVYQAYRHGSKSGVYERFEGHHGPVTGIDFHPVSGSVDFSNLFLSSSTDWTCKLWNQKTSTKPLYSFEDAGDYVYDVKWAPTHPAVFATVDGTGSLDLWNLNEETEVPVARCQVAQRALNRIRWAQDGKKILAGDSGGNLYLCDLGEIATPHADEWHKFEGTLSKLVAQTTETPNA